MAVQGLQFGQATRGVYYTGGTTPIEENPLINASIDSSGNSLSDKLNHSFIGARNVNIDGRQGVSGGKLCYDC